MVFFLAITAFAVIGIMFLCPRSDEEERGSVITENLVSSLSRMPSLCQEVTASFEEDVGESIVPNDTSYALSDARSVHLPASGTYLADKDAYLVCTDPIEMQQGSNYAVYSLDGSQLIQWETNSFSSDFTIYSSSIHVAFDYAAYNGQVEITHCDEVRQPTDSFLRLFHDTSRGPDRILLGFNIRQPDGNFLHYPMLLNLETEELTDFLAGIEQETLKDVLSDEIHTVVTADGNSFLAQRADRKFFFFDVSENRVIDLDAVSGKQVLDCILLPDKIVCWDSSGNFWKISIDTWDTAYVLNAAHVEFVNGISGRQRQRGSSFVLYRNESNELHMFDFQTEIDTHIDVPQKLAINADSCDFSHDSRKFGMLISSTEDENRYIVFDADSKTFRKITVEHPEKSLLASMDFTNQNEVVLASASSTEFYYFKLV